MNSVPHFESGRVINDGTAGGKADSSNSVCKFDMLDVLGAIGSAFAAAK
jgi:hypothetical protein